jgi:protein-disulfide isomerase
VYYKQYPMTQAHPLSMSAAQAALAASAQGAFEKMHDVLFAMAPRHSKEDVIRYAQVLKLNVSRFKSYYAAAKFRVDADKEEGNRLGAHGTPTIYVNGREYTGRRDSLYLGLAIEEELAATRDATAVPPPN